MHDGRYDLWISIDNVQVDNVVPFRARVHGPARNLAGPHGLDKSPVLVFSQDFAEDGIPNVWGVQSITGRGFWHRDECSESGLGDGGGVQRMDDDFAMMDSLCVSDRPEEDILITPAQDCSEFEEVLLVYDDEALWKLEAFHHEVLLSTDGGKTFSQRIFEFTPEAGWQACESSYFLHRVRRLHPQLPAPRRSLSPSAVSKLRRTGDKR